ncbi:MAG: PH adaptation potassium efflux system protein B1; sodium- potassium/hydrogen antiporter subunit B1 [uncultured Thiotrichaceae bacterium]|uniref:PH adaptation potassium efflux system protein B1 sodium- potassium/hydrogen antiporter subunit B1 n=1 Tax=uncultured Thiotrichaceae bacterium TaxID=298394 RepID=A0A6S6SDR3_9GAMM|nr:MAG: PH adaptation potassium efflux system protein B1; sodium- potassium/hydrogen antiporter subunit B1 [uncultured Thiotrichaceae bacterium]
MTIIRLRSLFAVVMLFSIYSLLTASLFMVLDAVDVAFTEAAVGAGISTMLMLGTLMITGYREKRPAHSPILPLIVVVLTGAVLVWGTLDMPHFGSPDQPVHQHVAPRYIDDSPKEVGIPNMVTSVLASYRGYDTMGETIVVFAALIGVLSLIGIKKYTNKEPGRTEKPPESILQVAAKLLIPFILLFALYVQFHGDFGPGGGFQAGVIFAAGIILYALTFSLKDAMHLAPPKVVKVIAAFGVLLYGGTGIVSMLKGGTFLNYSVLAHDPIHGQHYGILLVELGVGLTVASVMMLIFYAFVSRGEAD